MTVNDYLQDLYKMTQATITDKETGEPITVEDLQDLFYQEIEQLSDVLGIELEDQGGTKHGAAKKIATTTPENTSLYS